MEPLTRARGIEGANQSGMRDHNARAILSFIRRNGGMSSAEIARRSGLSAQTVSIIVRELEADGLLVRGDAVRSKGRVGKPQTPMQLNPQGVHSLGLNVGRRSSELVLVDFLGRPIKEHVVTYAYPTVEGVLDFLQAAIAKIQSEAPKTGRKLVGIGVSLPNEIWGWLEIVGSPRAAMERWRSIDLTNEVADLAELPVYVENDATSACIAEQILGRGEEFSDFCHLFVGAFIGGGLVLGDKIISGPGNRAASIGTMPIRGPNGDLSQLLNFASIYGLEENLTAAGVAPDYIRQNPDNWDKIDEYLKDWVDQAGHHLAFASAVIGSVVEVQAILIDGAFPPKVRSMIWQSTKTHLEKIELDGLLKPRIEEGRVGRSARSIGAALLPIHARYFPL